MISRWSLKGAIRQTPSRFAAGGLIFALLLLPVSASLATQTGDSVAVDLSGYEGHWQRVEVAESEAARESAIKKAVEGINWIIRRMAGRVLRSTTSPPPELQFAWDGERLHQGLADDNGGFSRLIELDGELIVLKDNRGVDFAAAWAWTGKGLLVHWEQHQATGSNIYRLVEDGQTIVVEHTIKITALSNIEPIVFLSRFSRTDLPARSAAGLNHVARVSSE